MDELRKPFFLVSVIFLLLAVLVELGTSILLDTGIKSSSLDIPGYGIPYLALLDGLLMFSLLSMSANFFIPGRIYGRLQGLITFIFTLICIIAAIVMIIVAFILLMLMISLLLAFPFGPAIYMAMFAGFPKAEAAKYITLIMTFKFGFVIFLLLAQQRFIAVKSLVLLILSSFLATIIVSFLHGFVPGILVSITDDIAAIIVAIIAAIWALVYLIRSIPGILKALRVDRAVS